MHRRHLPIAEPCGNDWNEMRGTSSVRFCGACSKNVYNLSMLTEREAKEALAVRPDDACVRYHVDASGDIVFYAEPALRRPAPLKALATAIAVSAMAACAGPEMTGSELSTSVATPVPIPNSPKPQATVLAQAVAAPEPVPSNGHKHTESCAEGWNERFQNRRSDRHLTASTFEPEDQGMVAPPRTQSARGTEGSHREEALTALAPAIEQIREKCEGPGVAFASGAFDERTGRLVIDSVTGTDNLATKDCVKKALDNIRIRPFKGAFKLKFPFRLRQP